MRLLIFDLDGTLIDSSRDIAISTNAMLRHLGRPEVDAKTVNSYVGNGVGTLVRRALGESAPEPEYERRSPFSLTITGRIRWNTHACIQAFVRHWTS